MVHPYALGVGICFHLLTADLSSPITPIKSLRLALYSLTVAIDYISADMQQAFTVYTVFTKYFPKFTVCCLPRYILTWVSTIF